MRGPEPEALLEQEIEEVFWLPYRSLSTEEYREQPQIMYVTADWCLTCVLFEKEVLMCIVQYMPKGMQEMNRRAPGLGGEA